MSCYICTPKHINYLVSQVQNLVPFREVPSFAHDGGRVYIREGYAPSITLQGLAEALLAENVASYNYRYQAQGDSAVAQPCVFKQQLRNEGRSFTGHLAEVSSAIRCFEYQACEHPAWEQSLAYSFCWGLREMVLNKLQSLYSVDYESSRGEWRPPA